MVALKQRGDWWVTWDRMVKLQENWGGRAVIRGNKWGVGSTCMARSKQDRMVRQASLVYEAA